ncbi:PREDICTED: Sjoegren syndrome/scleroderma autoantigen 1-like [Odobenus rosmarus divergens]|uniref:Sjoegren syndrome/scleroderma autoantigen 1-like n=1 Tax=Odobenus rosmarus divergens TaxID=9708 RepID=A0A9B0LH24_ODORO
MCMRIEDDPFPVASIEAKERGNALNAQAALSQAREHQLASASELPLGSQPAPQPPVPRPGHCEGAAAGLKAAQGPPLPAVPPNAVVLACTQEALLQKLTWASAELGSSASLETSIQLCSLIQACAEALRSLWQLQHSEAPPEKNPAWSCPQALVFSVSSASNAVPPNTHNWSPSSFRSQIKCHFATLY